MSLKKSLGKLLVFSVLEVGALCGVPIRPDDIEKLLEVMNRTRVVHIMKREGSDPPDDVPDPPDG